LDCSSTSYVTIGYSKVEHRSYLLNPNAYFAVKIIRVAHGLSQSDLTLLRLTYNVNVISGDVLLTLTHCMNPQEEY